MYRIFLTFIALLSYAPLFSQEENPDTFQRDILAPVKVDKFWGYINKEGKTVFPFVFDDAMLFSQGLAAVKYQGYWGYMDPKVKWFMTPVLSQAYNFRNGRAQVISYDSRDAVYITNFISLKKDVVFQTDPLEEFSDYHDGMVKVRSADAEGIAFGFRDSLGNWVIKPRFDAATDFHEGLAAVMIGDKWGFVDQANNYVIMPQYDMAFYFHEGLAYVKSGNQISFIDKKGEKVFTVKNIETAPFISEGMVAFSENNKMGFLNSKGKISIKAEFDNPVLSSFNDDLAPIARKTSTGLLWGYIDKSGKIVIEPQFEEAHSFFYGYALIKMNGKYGYINKAGTIVIKPQYDEAQDFSRTF